MEAGEAYYCLREGICKSRSIGLTTLYGLVNDPDIEDIDIAEMRAEIAALDASVASEYGFIDVELDYEWATPDSGDALKEKRCQYRLTSSARDAILELLFSRNQILPGIDPSSSVSTRSLKGKGKRKPL